MTPLSASLLLLTPTQTSFLSPEDISGTRQAAGAVVTLYDSGLTSQNFTTAGTPPV